jgi:hypothetical protein
MFSSVTLDKSLLSDIVLGRGRTIMAPSFHEIPTSEHSPIPTFAATARGIARTKSSARFRTRNIIDFFRM